jgi:hypothetical protein
MTAIFVIYLRLSVWKTHLPLNSSFLFVFKYFIQICCENSIVDTIKQLYQVFCILIEIYAIYNIITEYTGETDVKEFSIFMLDN